jgi:hypothetical protein
VKGPAPAAFDRLRHPLFPWQQNNTFWETAIRAASQLQSHSQSLGHQDNYLQANIMSTVFEPSLSTSAMRPPLSSADAPSMADSLPSINFGFDELRDQMAKFTVKFDNFIEQGRKRVLEERNQFRMNVAELQGRREMLMFGALLTVSQRISE